VSAAGIEPDDCGLVTDLLAKPSHRRLVLRDVQAPTWNAALDELAGSSLTTLEVGLSQTDNTALRPFDGSLFPNLERLIVQPQPESVRTAQPLRIDMDATSSGMPRLHSLACRTHDRDLTFLSVMPNLQHLHLLILRPGNQPVINDFCSDAGWRRLESLRFLKDIESVFYARPPTRDPRAHPALASMALMARPDGNSVETAVWRERSTLLGEGPMCSEAAVALTLPQPHLRHFTLGAYTWPAEQAPTLFTALPLLRSLTLELAFPEGALSALEGAPHFESLALGPNKGLAHLGFRPDRCVSLRSLSLTACPKLQRKKSTWAALATLPQLRELTLDMPERFPVAHLVASGGGAGGKPTRVARTLEILRLADHTDAGPGLVHDAWLAPLLQACQRLRRLLLHIVQTFTGASWLGLANGPSVATMEDLEVVVDDEGGSTSLEVGAFASLLRMRRLERLDLELPEVLAHPQLLLRILAATLPRLRYFASPCASEDGLDSDDFASECNDESDTDDDGGIFSDSHGDGDDASDASVADDDGGMFSDDRSAARASGGESDEDDEEVSSDDDDDGSSFDDEPESAEGRDSASCQRKAPSGADFESTLLRRPSGHGPPARGRFYYDTMAWQRSVSLDGGE
jgi:hypothetical protein